MNDIMKCRRGMVFWINDTEDNEKNNSSVIVNNRSYKSSVMAGTRPWLVVSSDVSNYNSGICNVIPITSSKYIDNSSYHVQFYYNRTHYTLLPEQIKTVDSVSLGNYLYTLSDDIMEKLDKVMMTQYGIKPKLCYTEEVLEEVVKLIEPSIQNILHSKMNHKSKVYSIENIEDIAIKIGQDIEDLFTIEEKKNRNDNDIVKESMEEKEVILENEVIPEKEKILENEVIPENEMDDKNHISKNKIEKIHPKFRKEKNKKWSLDDKKEFLSDCEKMDPNSILKKWGFSSKGSYYSTKYSIKKEFRMLEEKEKVKETV